MKVDLSILIATCSMFTLYGYEVTTTSHDSDGWWLNTPGSESGLLHLPNQEVEFSDGQAEVTAEGQDYGLNFYIIRGLTAEDFHV